MSAVREPCSIIPDNPHVQRLVENFHRQGKVIGAVCHGPAALVNVYLEGSTPFLSGRRITGFSNSEELLLMSDAENLFPFLLQSKLQDLGAEYSEGPKYLEHVVQDQNLLTGQNPWSVWALAEAMVRELGVEPRQRPVTRQERAVELLGRYESFGNLKARQKLSMSIAKGQILPDRQLIAMHSVVALMELKIGKAIDLLSLAKQIKNTTNSKGRVAE
ncbi:type 1 glutamine amidotransferase domain-containing protein [Gilvimarinus sp. SDUM040013]|uniref:type 1 glutamine amidotransferase domain-containing protein n=1 Tax=Gilvimarinus gilvus TaxID=3058038 RepID=UPI002672B84C|nr:type 1 glutamine amidotransferase domain-containing protein [Gilvimarinus sp. SDUM040013]MDO3387569.1 type 1 glutamine amidotransferase domain-containing protein [Gilvimarinus sp. SDUM040013]